MMGMTETLPDSKKFKLKPRAIIAKSNNEDFSKILEFIKMQCPEVKVVFVTSAPVKANLRVVKEVPFEMQKPFLQTFFTVGAGIENEG
jgi:hypothetical protein